MAEKIMDTQWIQTVDLITSLQVVQESSVQTLTKYFLLLTRNMAEIGILFHRHLCTYKCVLFPQESETVQPPA